MLSALSNSAIRWSAVFETGIAAIDKAHRALFERLHALVQAAQSGAPDGQVEARVSALHAQLVTHFEVEEQAWRAACVEPAVAEAHAAEHAQQWASHRQAVADALHGVTTPHRRAAVEAALVMRWLLGHLLECDLPLADTLRTTPLDPERLRDRTRAAVELSYHLGRLDGVVAGTELPAAQLEAILNAMSDGLVVAEESSGRVILTNPALCALTGRSSGALRQGTIHALHPPEAYGAVDAAFSKAFDPATELSRIETLVQHADGHTIPVEIASCVVEDRAGHRLQVGVFRDIQARRAIDEARVAAADRFRTLFEQLPCAAGAMDPRTQTLVLANRAFGELLGAEPEAMVGLTLADLPPAEAKDRMMEGFARAARGIHPGPARGFVMARRDNGLPVRVDIHHRPVHLRGRPVVVGLFVPTPDVAEPRPSEPFAALHDPVTGLLNGRGFEQAVAEHLHTDPLQRFALIRFDLDRFREVTVGDPGLGATLLRRVADRLEGLCPDAPSGRLDRDEFGVLVPRDPAQSLEAQVAQLMRALLGQPVVVDGGRLVITATTAVAQIGATDGIDGATMRSLRAALDKTKLSQGPAVVRALGSKAKAGKASKLAAIAQGVARGEFVLYYQPKVRLDRDEVVGFEALVRWRHPERGLLLPGHFLPELLNTPLMRTLGDQLVRQVLDQLEAWHCAGVRRSVAMNLSADQLADRAFVDNLLAALAERPQLDPRCLQVEVLESSAIDTSGPVLENIRRLTQVGIQLAIDDFGTGYSSLSLLQALPVSTVKIDRSFVLALTTDVRQAVIVDGVLGMARGLGRQVVAEGVETEVHGVRMIELGCAVAQGFAIAHAMPPEAIPGWVERWRRPAAWRAARPLPRAKLRSQMMCWDHQAWAAEVLERLMAGQSAALGAGVPACMVGEWLARARSEPALQPLRQAHSAVHAQAAQLLSEAAPRDPLDPALQALKAQSAAFEALLSQSAATMADEPFLPVNMA